MRVAITDANVFIDLLETDLIAHIFSIGYEIHTTFEVLNELFEEQQHTLQPFINDGLLILKKFNDSELSELQVQGFPRGLSIVDSGVLFYAKINTEYLILSNDKLLRKTAKRNQMEVHGTLWVLDCLHEQKLVTNQRLCDALKKLQIGNIRRLPVAEIKIRLMDWTDDC